MKKALEKEDFIESERARLNKILREGKVKADKKESMQLRSNILTSFIPVKTELWYNPYLKGIIFVAIMVNFVLAAVYFSHLRERQFSVGVNFPVDK